MRSLLRRLFNRPQRHYPTSRYYVSGRITCNCGYHSVWDYDLRIHFEEQGWIGK